MGLEGLVFDACRQPGELDVMGEARCKYRI